MLLEINNLTKSFGGLVSVNGFNMSVNQGAIAGLIGPNGAGKTTVFNLITGGFPPNKGIITFKKINITGKKPHQVAALGIGRTFQLNPLFKNFTVFQNVSASFHLHPRTRLLDIFFNTRINRKNEVYIKEKTNEILQLLGLTAVRDELAKNLPHGYRKLLGIARALATQPTLLLLDEPLSGMNSKEATLCMNTIEQINKSGITVVVIEHNMRILDICDRVTVISFGQKICEGTPREVRQNKEVIKAYLGCEDVA